MHVPRRGKSSAAVLWLGRIFMALPNMGFKPTNAFLISNGLCHAANDVMHEPRFKAVGRVGLEALFSRSLPVSTSTSESSRKRRLV